LLSVRLFLDGSFCFRIAQSALTLGREGPQPFGRAPINVDTLSEKVDDRYHLRSNLCGFNSLRRAPDSLRRAGGLSRIVVKIPGEVPGEVDAHAKAV
jgi:hypothetical protein